MSDLEPYGKSEVIVRRTMQRTLIVVGVGQLALTAVIKLSLILLGLFCIALVVLGTVVVSAPTLGVGTLAFAALLFVCRKQARTALNCVIVLVFLSLFMLYRALILTYVICAFGLVAGGVWTDRFSLTAFGCVLSIPIVLNLCAETKQEREPRKWTLPPEGHLLTNRLKSQDEAQSDGHELWRK